MLLRLADFSHELVVKIIDLLPREEVGYLTDISDYAFQKYYTDVLIASGYLHPNQNLPTNWYGEEEVEFGHLHDSSQMTKFDRVEFFIEFVKESGSRYIPRNLSFESPYDFLTFGKHLPDILHRALKTSSQFETFRDEFANINTWDFRLTSLNCGFSVGVVLPSVCSSLEDLSIIDERVEQFINSFHMFKNLQSLRALQISVRETLQGLDHLPKSLKALSIQIGSNENLPKY